VTLRRYARRPGEKKNHSRRNRTFFSFLLDELENSGSGVWGAGLEGDYLEAESIPRKEGRPLGDVSFLLVIRGKDDQDQGYSFTFFFLFLRLYCDYDYDYDCAVCCVLVVVVVGIYTTLYYISYISSLLLYPILLTTDRRAREG